MDQDAALRQHVIDLLRARQAHCTFEKAVANVPPQHRGTRPEDLPYSLWELVEHIRRAQHDILIYCQDPDYQHPSWPDDFWPEASDPPQADAWTDSISQVQADRTAMCDLVQDDRFDLYDTVPSSDEHTYLREALLVADHTAYHVGQIVTVRRQLDLWPPEKDGA